MKSKILVPVDFSPCSINALKNAVLLAKEKNFALAILHAYMVPVSQTAYSEQEADKEAEGMEQEIKSDMDNLKLLIPALKEIDYEFVLENGYSTDSIISYTIKNEVDLIIMGTRGKGRKGKSFLGSNTYSVISSVSCPVLAIPEIGNIRNIKKIVLAVDYEKIPSRASFDPLIELALLFNAGIDILHIGSKKKLDSSEIFEAKTLEQYFKKIKHRYRYLVGENEERKILNYLSNQKVGLLAIISKRRNFFDKVQYQSLTKAMILNIKTPIMVLQEA